MICTLLGTTGLFPVAAGARMLAANSTVAAADEGAGMTAGGDSTFREVLQDSDTLGEGAAPEVPTPTPTPTSMEIPTATATPTDTPSVTFVVNSTTDSGDANPGDGVCDDGTGACTLRAAAEETAQLDTPPSCEMWQSQILIDVFGIIDLSGPVSFQAQQCFRSVSVVGPGSGNLIIRGGGLVLGGSGAAGERAEVSGLTITGAPVGIVHEGANLALSNSVVLSDVVLVGNGEGIQLNFRASLTVRNSRIAENGSDGIGFGPFAPAITMEIFDSAVLNNGGAGIVSRSFQLVIARSIISGNAGPGVTASSIASPNVSVSDSTIASNGGAGLANSFGTSTTVTGSTISGNLGEAEAMTLPAKGGVWIHYGTATISNSTISENRSPGSGGGLYYDGGPQVELSNVTIANNTADSDADGTGDGGGVYVESATAIVSNTIIAANIDRGGEAPDCNATLTSGGHNLIQDTSGCAITGDMTGNLIGVDPLLAPLGDNGGATQTRALLAGSPAVDAGNPAGCIDANGQPLASDQRGVARPQFAACDIGAYEFACSNGVIDLGEQCDDGNLQNGDCCSSSCEYEPSGDPCADDGNVCTVDVCSISGTCIHPAGNAGAECRSAAGACDVAESCDGVNHDCPADARRPNGTSCSDGQFCNGAETCRDGLCESDAPACPLLCDEADDQCVTGCPPAPQSCRPAEKSLLLMKNKTDGKERLTWKWTKGARTSQTEFGNPITTANYAFCVYAGTAAALIGQSVIPAGANTWSAITTGYKYTDAAAAADGIHKVILNGSAKDKSKVLVKGKGTSLPELPLPVTAPLTVQLVNGDNGLCWGASFSGAQLLKNEMGQLKAKAP